MEISGKIYKVLPLQEGESQRGKWQKQDVVLEIEDGKYPKKLAISFWNDLVTNNSFQEGASISVEFNLESREYNNKWYTDIKAWRINKLDQSNSAATNNMANTPPPAINTPAHSSTDIPIGQIDDDLPF